MSIATHVPCRLSGSLSIQASGDCSILSDRTAVINVGQPMGRGAQANIIDPFLVPSLLRIFSALILLTLACCSPWKPPEVHHCKCCALPVETNTASSKFALDTALQ